MPLAVVTMRGKPEHERDGDGDGDGDGSEYDTPWQHQIWTCVRRDKIIADQNYSQDLREPSRDKEGTRKSDRVWERDRDTRSYSC